MGTHDTKKKVAWSVFFILLYLGILLILSKVWYSNGDDTYFYIYAHEMKFVEYLKWRYATWTGRMTGEAMVYVTFRLGIWFWRVANAAMLILLPMGILRLSAIVVGKKPAGGAVVASLAAYLWMAVYTFGYAAIWMNGSIFYTWSFACGIYAMIPLAEIAYAGGTKRRKFVWAIPLALLASMSIEQMGAVLVVFIFLGLVVVVLRRRGGRDDGESTVAGADGWHGNSCTRHIRGRENVPRGTILLLVQGILSLAAFLLLFHAPGNALRMADEIATWLPGYATLSLGHHLFIAVQWLLSSFANENKLFLCGIWAVAALLLWERHRRGDGAYMAASVCFIVVAALPYFGITALSDVGISDLDVLWQIDVIPSASDLSGKQAVALAWWAAMLVYTFLLLWRLRGRGYLMPLCFLAGIASEAVLFFSPTMYASGARVFYLTDLICLFVILVLSHRLRNARARGCLYFAIVLTGVLNFIYQIPQYAAVVGM